MDRLFKNFYRNFYLKSGGFIPTQPTGQRIYPGDYFQVLNGRLVIYGNIFKENIIDPLNVVIHEGLVTNNWQMSDGVSKPYAGRGTGQGPLGGDFEYSRQILSFASPGSFIFKASAPHAAGIANWNEIQQQLIIKMTQTVFSFREVYIATESVAAGNWALAVAGNKDAELEIATESESFGLVDIFGLNTARTIQSRDIQYYEREERRTPCFFKAKRLAVQDDRVSLFISDLITRKQQRHQWAAQFFNKQFEFDAEYVLHDPSINHMAVLDMLQANQLNPNTALQYFKWVDAGIDDIEKMFVSYE